MRIGYCSPFNPMKSGISDFSEELIWALKDRMDVVLFSPAEISDANIVKQFECHPLSALDNAAVRGSLDLIVYQVGNSPTYHGEIVNMLRKYPGVVEMHEIGLHHLVAAQTLQAQGKESYLAMMEYCHGERGVAAAKAYFEGKTGTPWDEHGLDMCMNRHIIDSARAVIAHSEMVKQMILGIRDDMPITNILLHVTEMAEDTDAFRRECREKLGLDQTQLIFGSFGLATSAKRIIPILDAVERFGNEQPERDFRFVIVGEALKELALEKQITARKLEGKVKVTGFTSLEDFKLYMGACDFCLNLRYPTQGESSASLQRMMGMGKPAIVTDVGTFSDYPDDIVLKVRYDEHEVEDILTAMRILTDDRKEFQKRSKKAVAFARENCDLQKNAEKYSEFFLQVIHGSWSADFEDIMVGRLCELGLTDEAYLQHICPAWKEFEE